MTEELWNERRAHLLTKRQLFEAQSALLSKLHQEATAELAQMGEKWVPPPPPPDPPQGTETPGS